MTLQRPPFQIRSHSGTGLGGAGAYSEGHLSCGERPWHLKPDFCPPVSSLQSVPLAGTGQAARGLAIVSISVPVTHRLATAVCAKVQASRSPGWEGSPRPPALQLPLLSYSEAVSPAT